MDHVRKRNLTFVSIGLLFVLSGVEYGRWVPTAPQAWEWEVLIWLVENLNRSLSLTRWICPPPPPAVILPTIWRYLQILEAPPYFLGLGLSAFSLSGLLTGPLFGFWSDRSGTTKSIVLFSNLFEIAGESLERGHMTTAGVGRDVLFELSATHTELPGGDQVTVM